MVIVERRNQRAEKLQALAEEHESTVVDELLEEYVHESAVPGICMNDGCDFTAEYEPDQREGWCEECNTRSVTSALVLAGII
jgi:hypothetical protein